MTRSTHEIDAHADKTWVTMLTNDRYVDGVVVLAYSLLKANSRHRLLVLLTPAVGADTRRRIAGLDNCRAADIDATLPPSVKTINYAFPHLIDSWIKLAMWNFEEYTRLVWLDADMLVLRNMDELFDTPIAANTIAAAPQCLCNALHFKNFPSYFQVAHCPLRGGPERMRRFNGGLLVASPSTAMYEELMRTLDERDVNQMHFAEQDLLNEHFADDWHAVDYVYNATKGISRAHPELWNLDVIKNIHYVGQKPWDCDMELAEASNDPTYPINKIWWDMHHEAVAYFDRQPAGETVPTSLGTVDR